MLANGRFMLLSVATKFNKRMLTARWISTTIPVLDTLPAAPKRLPKICFGCGATFQNINKDKVGYLPPMSPKEEIDEKELEIAKAADILTPKQLKIILRSMKPQKKIMCMKCHAIQHSGQDFTLQLKTNRLQFQELKNSSRLSLVVLVLDLMDIPNTIIPNLTEFAGQNDLLVLLNKQDLMPENYRYKQIKEYIMRQPMAKNCLDVIPVSGKSGVGMDLFQKYLKERFDENQDCYMVGCTSAGKSTLMNNFKRRLGHVDLITTSITSGTTAGILKISKTELMPLLTKPAVNGKRVKDEDINRVEKDAADAPVVIPKNDNYLLDTGGIVQPNQLFNLFNQKQLKYLLPSKPPKHHKFDVAHESDIWIGGICKLEIVGKASVSLYISPKLPVQMSSPTILPEQNRMKLSDFPTVFIPSPRTEKLDFPELSKAGVYEGISPSSTFWLSGIGWFTIDGPRAKCKVLTPNGIGLAVTKGFSLTK
jgi:30S ribosome assembly GTPase